MKCPKFVKVSCNDRDEEREFNFYETFSLLSPSSDLKVPNVSSAPVA